MNDARVPTKHAEGASGWRPFFAQMYQRRLIGDAGLLM
jgi:hypothetical protein